MFDFLYGNLYAILKAGEKKPETAVFIHLYQYVIIKTAS
jgi:hypothetical protein